MAATQLGSTKDNSVAEQSPQVVVDPVVDPVAVLEQQLQLEVASWQHPGSDPRLPGGSAGGGAPPEMATDGEASSSLSKCIDFSAENRLRLTNFLYIASPS